MVEQLGLAIILSSADNRWPLISGTTNLMSGSILQADELSITIAPLSENDFACSSESSLPAENKARSIGFVSASSTVINVCCSPLNSIFGEKSNKDYSLEHILHHQLCNLYRIGSGSLS